MKKYFLCNQGDREGLLFRDQAANRALSTALPPVEAQGCAGRTQFLEIGSRAFFGLKLVQASQRALSCSLATPSVERTVGHSKENLWRSAGAPARGEAGHFTTSDARGLFRWSTDNQVLNRGKTVTKPIILRALGKTSSEKQIPQVIENPESGDQSREALETVGLRVKQAL